MQEQFLPTEDERLASDPFEAKIIQRVMADFAEAEEWLREVHQSCFEAFEAFHNARSYADLKKKNQFPMPIVQTNVEQYVSHLMDKLMYAGKPCTVIGVEEGDKEDAEAKQEMMAFQDRKDNMSVKLEKALRDSALYPYTVVQVDYDEKTTKKWQQVPVDVPIEQSWIDRFRGLPQQFTTEIQWRKVDVVTYRGATTKRVDPTDCFFGPDKREIEDRFPVMIRSKQDKAFFNSRPYFQNQDQIRDVPPGDVSDSSEENAQKRDLLGVSESSSKSEKNHQYIEWQGWVNSLELYEYLGQDTMGVDPEHECFVIAGVADGTVLARIEEDPLQIDRPNVVIGWATPEEDELFGASLYDRMSAVHKGAQVAMGILLENLKQSVSAMWIINTTALIKGGSTPLVNVAGHVLQTNENVNNVAKRVEQPPVAQDIYKLLSMFEQLGQDTTFIQDTIQGRAEKGVSTLGEASILAGQAELGLRRALRCFEATLIEPLYELRNEINCNFLDEDYVFQVIGDGVVNWRTVTPEQVRARVDFVCESSTRETNRAVIGQQILQLMEMAPIAQGLGQPVRADHLMLTWLKTMGSMRESEALKFFPLIQMEKLQGFDANQAMVQMAMMKQQRETMGENPSQYPGEQGPPGERPQPTSEAGAIESANAQNQPQVGAM